jgi:hypothetical protein
MPRLHSAFLRLLLCAACLLLAGGCSTVRIAYNNLDAVATWMAHDYFDLDAAQRDEFARRFERLHAWHRREELPEYIRFLKTIRQRTARGLRADDALWVVDGLKQHYARIAAHSAADAAALLRTLTPAQLASFRLQLVKSNRKFRETHRSDDGEAARRKAFERRALEQLHDWVGPLTEAQEKQVIGLLQVPLVDELRHRDRLRRQREFFTLLELRHGDRAEFTRRVRDWLVNWESGRNAADARLVDAAWQVRAGYYAAVDRLLTAEQRRHLLYRLQDYIDDLSALSGP